MSCCLSHVILLGHANGLRVLDQLWRQRVLPALAKSCQAQSMMGKLWIPYLILSKGNFPRSASDDWVDGGNRKLANITPFTAFDVYKRHVISLFLCCRASHRLMASFHGTRTAVFAEGDAFIATLSPQFSCTLGFPNGFCCFLLVQCSSDVSGTFLLSFLCWPLHISFVGQLSAFCWARVFSVSAVKTKRSLSLFLSDRRSRL